MPALSLQVPCSYPSFLSGVLSFLRLSSPFFFLFPPSLPCQPFSSWRRRGPRKRKEEKERKRSRRERKGGEEKKEREEEKEGRRRKEIVEEKGKIEEGKESRRKGERSQNKAIGAQAPLRLWRASANAEGGPWQSAVQASFFFFVPSHPMRPRDFCAHHPLHRGWLG